MSYAISLLIDIGIGILVVLSYYKWGKTYLFKLAPAASRYAGLTRFYPLATATGIMELTLAALSHVLLCILFILISGIEYGALGLFTFEPMMLLYGVLLGAGTMATSSLISRGVMETGRMLLPQRVVPRDLQDWLILSRAGWLRHHMHAAQTLPRPIWLLIILLQVGSEELMFRGIFLNFYGSYNHFVALAMSTMLFVYMQTFLMPSWLSAMFPAIGGLVLGVVHGFLYLEHHSLLPLVVAHVTFFILAVF